MSEEAVTAAELAEVLRCSTEKVYRMARAGEIPAIRVGRSWRFYPTQVKEHLSPSTDTWARSSRSMRRGTRSPG